MILLESESAYFTYIKMYRIILRLQLVSILLSTKSLNIEDIWCISRLIGWWSKYFSMKCIIKYYLSIKNDETEWNIFVMIISVLYKGELNIHH